MNKRDFLDSMVILTGMAFFILIIIAIGGNYEYTQYAVVDLLACILFMKWANDAHQAYNRGRVKRMIKERKVRVL